MTSDPGRRRILVADDNQDSANSLSMMLSIMGNEVRTAFDGAQALEVAKDFEPQLIFLDIGMPKIDGYEASRHIRTHDWGKAAVLVALTGWGQDEDELRSREAGFNLHLVKPVEVATLEEILARVPPRA
jgi:CheY-like chemotaxis protein